MDTHGPIIPALLFHCIMLSASCCSKQPQMAFVKHPDSDKPGRVIYEVKQGDCAIAWTLGQSTETGVSGIREYSQCRMPIEKQAPLRDRLFAEIENDLNTRLPLEIFYWGRLQRDDATGIFSARLSELAANAKDWDAERGRSRDEGQSNEGFVEGLLRSNKCFTELEEVFERHGYRIRVEDVEKVLVGKVNGKTLPVDAAVSFKVEKVRNGAGSRR